MLCMLLPTNDYASMARHLLPTLDKLSYINESICFAINFQDYSAKEIETVLGTFKKYNLSFRYTVNKYPKPNRKGLIKFNKIRYDCAVLYPEADIYGLCDDDFELGKDSDLMIQDILHFFDITPTAGLVQCAQKPFFVPHEYSRRNCREHTYFTNDGFFFRNIKQNIGGLVFPPTALDNVGACEESVIGFEISKHGYDTYLRTRSEIKHVRDVDSHGVSPYLWGSNEIVNGVNGNFTFIKNNYKEVMQFEK